MTKDWAKAMSAEEALDAMKRDGQPRRHTPQGTSEPPRAAVRDELRRVDALYGQAMGYAHKFMDDVRNGKPFDFREAAPLVSDFIDSIFRNDSAAAAIGKLKAFDEYTYTHCINVSILAVILGKKLGYPRETLELLGIAGIFHDVGKARIPERILNKPGKLTEAEMNVMRTHPLLGYQLLKDQPSIPEEVLRGCLEHHEKHDGSGYPRGLRGDAISDFSRLLAVVDVYDALTSRRVYKEPLPPGKVLAMMYTWRVTDFHPNIVEQFIRSLGVYPVGSFVRLTSGDHAVVVDHNTADPLKPMVRVAYDHAMRRIPLAEENLSGREDGLCITDVVNPDDHRIDVYALLQ